MATFTDTAVGLVCILLALLIWTYFTMWTIVTPFMDPTSPVQDYFADRKYALILPGIGGAGIILAGTSFVSSVMAEKAKKK